MPSCEEEEKNIPHTRAVDAQGGVSDGQAADPTHDIPAASRADAQGEAARLLKEIQPLYGAILPFCPKAQVHTPAMLHNLALNIESWPERREAAFWKNLFQSARASPFLRGERKGKDGRVFTPDLGWFFKPDNVGDILNGKYPPGGGQEKKYARDAKDYGNEIRPIGS